jgi:cell division protein FtsQ
MQRSLAARLPLARRPHAIAWPVRLQPASIAALLRRSARARAGALACLLALPLLGGGWLWLRGSSLVAIERVQLTGVSGPERPAIEGALRGAARRMTTLDFNTGALRAAVAAFPVVLTLRARTSFPHGLVIFVQERPPVAAIQAGGWRSAIAADGVVLGPALLSSSLPEIDYAHGLAVGRTVSGTGVRAMLAVMGAAPRAIASKVAKLYSGPQGLTLSMRNGLTVYFGDAARAPAKWTALERVLADTSSHGASYVDVRLPERPAAGFATGAGAAEATSAASTESGGEPAGAQGVGGSEATISALAEQLREQSARDGGTPSQPAAGTSTTAAPGSTGAGSEPGTEASGTSTEAAVIPPAEP